MATTPGGMSSAGAGRRGGVRGVIAFPARGRLLRPGREWIFFGHESLHDCRLLGHRGTDGRFLAHRFRLRPQHRGGFVVGRARIKIGREIFVETEDAHGLAM